MQERYHNYILRKLREEGKEMTDGPFQAAFDSDTTGVVRREITTYRYKNGIMVKETATRSYARDGDYHDTISTLPLPDEMPRQLNLSI
jgi:hypothetical protein